MGVCAVSVLGGAVFPAEVIMGLSNPRPKPTESQARCSLVAAGVDVVKP